MANQYAWLARGVARTDSGLARGVARFDAPLLRIVAGSLVAALGACADQDTSDDDLLDTEATIEALRSSGAAAQSEAAACFETFKTCQASATAGDSACRDALEACLPDRAPRGAGCGPPGDAGHGDGGVAPAPGDAGVRPRPGDAGDHERPDAAGGRGERDGGFPTPGDAGPGNRGPGGGGNSGADDHRGPMGGGGGRGDQDRGPGRSHCGGGGDFDGPDHAIGGCRDRTSASLRGGMSMDGAQAQHQKCTLDAFDASLAKLCAKATQQCAQPNAPADVCARVKSVCANLPASDAGVKVDAGP